jgi:hypothetical protein
LAQIFMSLSLLILNCNSFTSFSCRDPGRLLSGYGPTAPTTVRVIAELPLKS